MRVFATVDGQLDRCATLGRDTSWSSEDKYPRGIGRGLLCVHCMLWRVAMINWHVPRLSSIAASHHSHGARAKALDASSCMTCFSTRRDPAMPSILVPMTPSYAGAAGHNADSADQAHYSRTNRGGHNAAHVQSWVQSMAWLTLTARGGQQPHRVVTNRAWTGRDGWFVWTCIRPSARTRLPEKRKPACGPGYR